MALKSCTECGNQVSTEAETCPKCGARVKRKTAGIGTLLLVVLGLPIVVAVIEDSGRTQPTSPPPEKLEGEECLADLKCAGELASDRAYNTCIASIERQAKHVPRWRDGARFAHFAWTDQPGGSVDLIGDALELQNSFGAWSRHAYRCTVDVQGNTVTNVQIFEGAL